MPSTLLMLLIVGDPRAEWVEGLKRSLEATLDADQKLQVSTQSSQRELDTSLERLQGDASLCLAAIDFPRSLSRARIRMRPAHSSQWLTREVTFQDADAATERGRALGFSLSAMLQDKPLAARPAPSHGPAPTEARPGRPTGPASEPAPLAPEPGPAAASEPLAASEPDGRPQAGAVPERAAASESGLGPPAASEPAAAAAPQEAEPTRLPAASTVVRPGPGEAVARPRWWRLSAEVAGQGSWSLGRSTPDGGARVTAQLLVGSFAARVGGTFLGGSLREVSATALQGGPFVGAGFMLLDDRFSLGARLDLAMIWLSLTRESQQQGRWLLALQPRVETGVVLWGPVSAVLAIGVDVGLSSTRVFVDRAQQANVQPVAFAGELGVRARF